VRWGFDGSTPEVLLVLTELVSNAVRHGRGQVRVSMTNRGTRDGHDHLLLAVADEAPEPLPLTLAQPGSAGGRGLFLVRALSSRWGIDYGSSGKTVWAELDV
jgi:two-component sensor histidine kinase